MYACMYACMYVRTWEGTVWGASGVIHLPPRSNLPMICVFQTASPMPHSTTPAISILCVCVCVHVGWRVLRGHGLGAARYCLKIQTRRNNTTQ